MRMVEVEEIAEATRRRKPEISRARWWLRPEAQAEARSLQAFDELVSDLSSELIVLAADRFESGLGPALESLALGLRADQVCFLRPAEADGIFEVEQVWERPREGDGPFLERIDLAARVDLAERLAAGETVLLPATPASMLDGRPARGQLVPRTHDRRSTLLVPCLGPTGLLGLIVVEAGLSAARWSAATLRRALWVGQLLASFLERHRLSKELATSRARQLHDERMETLGRVASSVAHDLNNVLTAIQGYGELLEMELGEDDPGQADLAEIQAAATRATGLVEQVLCFGRRRPVGVKRLDLAESVTGLSGMVERVLGDRVELSLDLAADAPAIAVDPVRLEQVLLNLASNARDAVAAAERGPGHFHLESRVITVDEDGRDPSIDPDRLILRPSPGPGHYLRLGARDDGCGIDPAIEARLFEPFFTTKREGFGTGLGLATAAEVLREAGGSIGVESDPGRGSCFYLYFPLASQAAVSDVSSESPGSPGAHSPRAAAG